MFMHNTLKKTSLTAEIVNFVVIQMFSVQESDNLLKRYIVI